jgi:hypothetical protein
MAFPNDVRDHQVRAASHSHHVAVSASATVFSGDGTAHIIAEPHQITLENRECCFHSGGLIKANGEDVITGTTIKITPERGKNGTVCLKVFLEYTDVISQAEDSLRTQTNQPVTSARSNRVRSCVWAWENGIRNNSG